MENILNTEMRNPKTMHLDKMNTSEIVEIMTDENFCAANAVKAASNEISEAIDIITEAFSKGGRLFFIGAGTSGRLGILDASECPPTFGVPYDMVVGIIAGGEKSLTRASENAEDSRENGMADILSHKVCQNDCVVGISASGGASYVVGALCAAKENGAKTVALTCNYNSPIEEYADITVVTDTGAEVVTGSTRLKAGTAHKMVLNILTTASMIKSGYIYENMMINLKPSNAKLRNRMINIVREIIACDSDRALFLLENNEWNIKKAIEYAKQKS